MAKFVKNETPIEWNNLLDDRLSKAGRVITGETYEGLIAQLKPGEGLVGTGFICPGGWHDFGAVIRTQDDLQDFKRITYDSGEDRAKWYQFVKKRVYKQKVFGRWRYYAVSDDYPTVDSDLEIKDLTRKNVKKILNRL